MRSDVSRSDKKKKEKKKGEEAEGQGLGYARRLSDLMVINPISWRTVGPRIVVSRQRTFDEEL